MNVITPTVIAYIVIAPSVKTNIKSPHFIIFLVFTQFIIIFNGGLRIMKEITMSIHDFMEIQRNNVTYKELKNLNTLDDMVEYILKNPKLKTIVIASIAYMNINLCAYASELDSLRSAKNEIISVLQVCIGIICIVMCILEIGKALIGHRSTDISSIVMKYGSALVGVCLIPKVFTWIAKLCGVQL
ncbi:hypothetical protein CLSAB_19590 [Clostridium saccharobutylicum]|nr:hypothetical protein CLSAB_19590 [Clostridium saccharobutylicum]